MILRAAPRIDFAGGFVDNIAFERGVRGYFTSGAIRPLVSRSAGTVDLQGYRERSGLAISTSLSCLEYLQQLKSGPSYLATTGLESFAQEVWEYENRKYNIEVGKGDVWPIVLGGLRCFECNADRISICPIQFSAATLAALEQQLVLVDSGRSRDSEHILNEFSRRYDSGTGETREAFATLSQCGRAFAETLATGDIAGCGTIMHRNWEAEKVLAPSVTAPYLDAIYEYAVHHGATGGKLCGAGGGGYFIFVVVQPHVFGRDLISAFPECALRPFALEPRNLLQILTDPPEAQP